MSFDIYFCKKKDSPLTEKDVAEYLTRTLPINNSEYNRQWHYENPETEVYFIIDWNEPNAEAEDIAPDCCDKQYRTV